MDEETKLWIQEQLDNLPYVSWDRYVKIPIDEAGNMVYRFFGWIEREKDSYKDFVVIELVPKHQWVYFMATSSSKYSNDIANKLSNVHIPCKKWDKITT